MRRLLTTGLLLSAMTVFAQTGPPTTPETPAPPPEHHSARPSQCSRRTAIDPDNVVVIAEAAWKATGSSYEPCNLIRAIHIFNISGDSNSVGSDAIESAPQPCNELYSPYQHFLTIYIPVPLTPKQKGLLAVHNATDVFNVATIALVSGVAIAADPDTAYGPGLKGFGKNFGVSLLQAATGEFFGTFAIPSIVHEDPHYHRMPHGTVPRRILHAISRTVIAQSDSGNNMPNYSTLLTYPINTELSNLYVPGIESDGRSTALRIVTGYALDPTGNLVAEFLPDLAKRVHIRIVVIQRILNQISSTPGAFPHEPLNTIRLTHSPFNAESRSSALKASKCRSNCVLLTKDISGV